MTPLVGRKKRNFSTTSMLCDRYSGFPPLHREPTKCLKGGRVLAFYRIAPCLKSPITLPGMSMKILSNQKILYRTLDVAKKKLDILIL